MHLLVDEFAQRDLGPPFDLEANEFVDLIPVPLLQALVAEVDYHGEYGAEVVHVLLLDQGFHFFISQAFQNNGERDGII